MSLSKGNVNRTRPQKHQNKSVFKNDLHDTSKKTKILNSLNVSGVCSRCKDIIEWKIKYKKYKPLSTPSKCVACNQKAVKYAYHVLCTRCAADRKVCAKCQKTSESDQIIQEKKMNENDYEFHTHLKGLSERKRRTILRHLKKLKSNDQNISESDLEKMVMDLDKFNFCDDIDEMSDDNLEDDDCKSDC